MALPQQVLDRLSREPPKTPGWSSGLLLFCGAILFITLAIYVGLVFGYEPYLNGKVDGLNAQINTVAKSISADDEARLITFYSEITNLKNVLANHVALSRFFSWLEKNTEANIYFSRLSFSSQGSGNQVTLSGSAPSEADINQQTAIFESSPQVRSVNISSVSKSQDTGQWIFNATLVLNAFKATQ